MTLTMFGIELPPETPVQIEAAILAGSNVLSWI